MQLYDETKAALRVAGEQRDRKSYSMCNLDNDMGGVMASIKKLQIESKEIGAKLDAGIGALEFTPDIIGTYEQFANSMRGTSEQLSHAGHEYGRLFIHARADAACKYRGTC
jgi:hypothetical protein